MIFSSNVFLFAFLPIVLLLYYICPRPLRNPVLLLWSLVFYGWGEPVYLFLMIVTILLNYLFGRMIHEGQRKGRKVRTELVIAVAVNLMMLGYFKYAGFFIDQLSAVFPGLAGLKADLPAELPIGISFYIFQSMSYVIDVYRSDAPVQKNVLTFGTYVTLFPQLIAGPIVRYYDVAQQMDGRKETVSRFAEGVIRFVIGLAKKLLIANAVGILWEGTKDSSGNVLVMGLVHYEGTLSAWVGILAYALQIYFDFSGYSDMAIGLGKMFGFTFLENFNYPYISRSITEFWRRWHISLSTWFKEYVYIPLGGNRKGLPRQVLNLLVVWALTGFWHGASWNFLLWGLYYAVLLILEKLVLLKLLKKLPKVLCHVYSVLLVLFGWALFYFVDMRALGEFFGRLFTWEATSAQTVNLILSHIPILLIGGVAATPVLSRLSKRATPGSVLSYLQLGAVVILMLLCVATMASQSYNPFIYFRF